MNYLRLMFFLACLAGTAACTSSGKPSVSETNIASKTSSENCSCTIRKQKQAEARIQQNQERNTE